MTRPCDCRDLYTIEKELYVNGMSINENSITIKGGPVIIEIGPCTVKIPFNHFKQFAEWFLEDQKEEDYKPLEKGLKLLYPELDTDKLKNG